MAVDAQPPGSSDVVIDGTDRTESPAMPEQHAFRPVNVAELPPKLQQLAANWPFTQQRLAELLATRPHDRPPDTACATIFSYGGECAVCQQRTQPLFAVVRARTLSALLRPSTVLLSCHWSCALHCIRAQPAPSLQGAYCSGTQPQIALSAKHMPCPVGMAHTTRTGFCLVSLPTPF